MIRLWTLLLLGGLAAVSRADVTIYTLNGNYQVDASSPVIETYSSISSFQGGTGSQTTRSSSQGFSSDISIAANGTVYFMNGKSDGTNDRFLYSWSSLANWASNTGGTLLGTRATVNNSPVMGMSVYNNELYLLEGAVSGGSATLKKWASFSDWASGIAGTTVGTRGVVGSGFGFEIAADGSVWKLDSTNPASDTSGTLYSWSSVNNFLSDTGATAYAYSAGGPYAGLGVVSVPEPGTMLMGTFAACSGGAGVWWKRRKRKAGQTETVQLKSA